MWIDKVGLSEKVLNPPVPTKDEIVCLTGWHFGIWVSLFVIALLLFVSIPAKWEG